MAKNQPLTEQDLARINDNLRQITDAQEAIRQAEMAGLDMATQKETCKDCRNKLLKLKQAYFPGK